MENLAEKSCKNNYTAAYIFMEENDDETYNLHVYVPGSLEKIVRNLSGYKFNGPEITDVQGYA